MTEKMCDSCNQEATGMWGCQMITSSKCEVCSKEITNGSTDVNKVCDDCSDKNGLCVKCGRILIKYAEEKTEELERRKG